MEYSAKRNAKNLILIVFLMAVAWVCRKIIFTTEDAFVAALLTMLRNCIHISIVAVWTVSIYMRVINKSVRSLLMTVGVMMVGWLLVRTCKWEFLETTDALTRYLWYAFYIPMIMIALIGVFITRYIGQSDSFVLPKKYRLLYIPALLLILVVFTNDYHRFMFEFPNGIYYFDTSYTYNFFFFIVGAWFVLLGFYFVLMLLLKSRVPGSRSFQKVHIFIMGGAVIFWCVYSFVGADVDLTAVDCTLITLLLECAIQSGLIRTNTNYAKLFEIASVTAQIVDDDFTPHLVSQSACVFEKEAMQAAVATPQNFGDFILNCEKISGGYVFWQYDIKDITEQIETLQETQKRLSENNDLLQAEIELKEKQAKTEEKTRLFSKLIQEISPQLAKADALLDIATENPPERNRSLAKLAVLGAYIKRRGNLFLLSEDRPALEAKELEFCLLESLSNLQLLGVLTSLTFELQKNLSTETAVRIYDIFEFLTEEIMEHASAVLVKLCEKEDCIFMRMMVDVNQKITINTASDALQNAEISFEYGDEDLTIDIRLAQGGIAV